MCYLIGLQCSKRFYYRRPSRLSPDSVGQFWLIKTCLELLILTNHLVLLQTKQQNKKTVQSYCKQVVQNVVYVTNLNAVKMLPKEHIKVANLCTNIP